ncbi:uncharacterized protein LOC125178971 [Hyalella azteca]|uniref:Uncharacterized protein LOC125178971 n=1 Tax=Hyalella azteca TaxID=294128 RepID=A0A979FRY6_HYAAZ|nr:uncharacterized protein LOC125178971 [Hyalella azteca]
MASSKPTTSASSTPTSSASTIAIATDSKSCFQEMEIISKNKHGIFTLCPKYTRRLIDIECKDKKVTESYMSYMDKHQIKHSHKAFKAVMTPENLDMTELFSLFQCLFEVKKDGRDTSEMLKKVRKVKDIRNDVTHNGKALKDATTCKKIEEKLLQMIQEAGKFYSLSSTDIRAMEDDLQQEIHRGLPPGVRNMEYYCYCILNEGKEVAKVRFQNFTTEDLPLAAGLVERTEVFHPPEVTLQDKDDQALPLQNLFDSSNESIVILSGVVGAGKTTLLKYITQEFWGLKSNVPNYLKGFETLVYIECRDRNTNNLQQIVRNHFGRVCTDIGETNVLKALMHLRVLILVDGFDEANENSKRVIGDLLKRTWHSESRILITTRPQAVEKFKSFVARNVSKISGYKIAPLSDLDEQLKFIERYERILTKDPADVGAMQERFSKLDPQLRRSFTEPISLLHFCSIFKTSPEKILRWKSFNDVSRDILQLQKTIVKEKLCDIIVANKDVLIDDLFMVTGKLALEFLACNQITFNEDELRRFKQQCNRTIKSHGANEFDCDVLLSAILRMKKTLSGNMAGTYSFAHKSLQEIIAAHYVTGRLVYTDEPISKIVGDTSPSNPRTATRQKTEKSKKPMQQGTRIAVPVVKNNLDKFVEVLEYVIQNLSSSNPPQFRIHWPELRDAITSAGVVKGRDWQPLLLRNPDETELAKHAAKITIAETKDWNVHSANDATAISLMLPYETPLLINIRLPSAVLRTAQQSWSEIAHIHRGELKLDFLVEFYITPENCDDLLECLRGSRCQLSELKSSISSAAAVAVVASVSTAATELHVALTAPLNLEALQGKYKRLNVEIRPMEAAWAQASSQAQSPRLPAQPPPELVLLFVDPGSCIETVAGVIRAIAPVGKTCQLSELKSSISSAAAVAVVASVSTAATELHVALTAPLNLEALQGKYKRLNVEIRPMEAAWAQASSQAQSPRLPAQPPPELVLLFVDPGSCIETVAGVIRAIAPVGKTFGKIMMPGCGLQENEIWKLMEQLHSAGIRSCSGGHTRYIKNALGDVVLNIGDDLIDPTRTETVVRQVIADVRAVKPGDFEDQWPEVQRRMEEVGATALHWRLVLLTRPYEAKIALFAAVKCLGEDGQFEIRRSKISDLAGQN